MKKFLISLGLLVLILIAFLLFNTFRFESKQNRALGVKPAPPLSPQSISNFQAALRYKTISYDDTLQNDTAAFKGFQKFLRTSYPRVHRNLTKEIINNYSLLYTWKGTNVTKPPIILIAHYDVVPVEEQSKTQWEVDPFGGIVKDDFIWGRGTVDNKGNLISMLEAVEKLLQDNFRPTRTIYFVFGHDEEVGGLRGAKVVAQRLIERGVRSDLILDEGGIITTDRIPNVNTPVALLGTAEKGYLTLNLSVEKNGGHSSMPESETAIDILMKALVKLRSTPLPARITSAQQDFIEHVGPELPFIPRMVFANAWLFESVIIDQYSKTGTGNALMRTTLVPTIVSAGIKENVVPMIAAAKVNLRLLPGDRSEEVVSSIKEIVDDDRIKIEVSSSMEAIEKTTVKSFGYKLIDKTVTETFDNTLTSPFLLIGGTDSKHFTKASNNIIRFSPVVNPIGFHGINERISLESYRLSIWFYTQLFTGLD